ncbi:uncharacterized protein [Musca autumnalis]|uniref:uncharacterized protein n=1 Tax=Musca autumnalis TaxID=221902 RepID=UPI003CF54587
MGKNKLNVAKGQEEVKQKELDDSQELAPQPVATDDVDNGSSANAFLWLFAFSVLMFTFPFITFYGVRSWLQESFDFDTFQTNCFSVLASVLVVNFILCLYVYKAFSEKSPAASDTSSGATTPPIDNKKNK